MKTVILNGEKIKELLNLRKLACAEISRKMGMNEKKGIRQSNFEIFMK